MYSVYSKNRFGKMMNTLKPLRWQSNKNSTLAFPLGARNATIALCVRSTTYNIIKYWWLRHTRGGAKRLHLLLLFFFLLVSNFHGHPLNARLHHPTLFIRYRKICTKLKKRTAIRFVMLIYHCCAISITSDYFDCVIFRIAFESLLTETLRNSHVIEFQK